MKIPFIRFSSIFSYLCMSCYVNVVKIGDSSCIGIYTGFHLIQLTRFQTTICFLSIVNTRFKGGLLSSLSTIKQNKCSWLFGSLYLTCTSIYDSDVVQFIFRSSYILHFSQSFDNTKLIRNYVNILYSIGILHSLERKTREMCQIGKSSSHQCVLHLLLFGVVKIDIKIRINGFTFDLKL